MIKTREQNDRRKLTLWQSFKYHVRSSLSKSTIDGLKRNHSLYKGFWFSNLTSIPIYGMYLGVYVYSKDQLNTSNNRLARFYAPFIAGCLGIFQSIFHSDFSLLMLFFLADAVCILLYVPSDVIVQRLQLVESPYKSGYDAIRQIYKNDGIKGYYRGLGATFLFTSTYSATWWTVYENAKLFLYDPLILPYLTLRSKFNDDKTNVHRMPQVLAGFIAGTVTALCMNPIDVVKTRIQTQHIQAVDKSTSMTVYKNVFHGLKNLFKEEGIRGLSKGLIPKLISRGPLSAMSAVVFELVLYYSKKI